MRPRTVLALTLLATPVASSALAGFAGTDLFIPMAGRGVGAYPSNWFTTVYLYNPNATAVGVDLSFLERNKDNVATSPPKVADSLAPGETKVYENIVESTFGKTAYGAVRIQCAEKVVASARVFSKESERAPLAQSFGQDFAATPASFAIGLGGTSDILGGYTTQPYQDSQARFNIGCVETTGVGSATVRWIARDAAGQEQKHYDRTVPRLSQTQGSFHDYFSGVDLTTARISANVISGSGKVICYGSLVTNDKEFPKPVQDPTTFEMVYPEKVLGTTTVQHDATLTGDGTAGAPLGIAAGAVTKGRLAASGGDPGMVLGTDGKDLAWWFPERPGLPWPFRFDGSDAGALFAITNGTGIALDGRTQGETGIAVRGIASDDGTAINRGGYFESYGINGRGVEAATNGVNGWAVYGLALGDWGRGVFGEARSGGAVGVQGQSTTGDGVVGTSDASTKSGVYGVNTKVDGYGVFGRSGSTPGAGRGYAAGVGGDGGSTGAGVAGTTSATGGIAAVEGSHWNSRAYGALGTESIGVVGESPTNGSMAGYFHGDVEVTNSLKKGGGAFRIDHPLDPTNQVLQHSFVESPDMLNVYNGIAVLDHTGAAVVELPAYFEALNRDFRYQLTCIGGFAPVFIAEEVRTNRFVIGGGRPGLRVSWQVTGIRQDPWANAYRIVVEEAKGDGEQGRYLHPGVYGQPEEQGISRILAPTRALRGHDQPASRMGGQP